MLIEALACNMSILHLLDKSVVIKRLKTVSGSKKNMVATMTVDIHIQSTQDLPNAEYYAAFEATHKAWHTEDSGILEGDKVIDAQGTTYDVVKIISKKYGFAMNQHVELMLKENG